MKTSGGRFRSSDLWVMSPTRFRCATPLSGDHNGSNPPRLGGIDTPASSGIEHPELGGIDTGTGRLGTTTFGIDTLRAVLWITGNSGIETPGNPGVGFEPYGSKPRSRVRTPSGSKPQESGSNPRDRNPRSRVRTLGIETHESGSNPIGIETQEGSNPTDRNPRVGFEPYWGKVLEP